MLSLDLVGKQGLCRWDGVQGSHLGELHSGMTGVPGRGGLETDRQEEEGVLLGRMIVSTRRRRQRQKQYQKGHQKLASNYLPQMLPIASLPIPHRPPPLLRISSTSSRKPAGPALTVSGPHPQHLPHCDIGVPLAPCFYIFSIGFGTQGRCCLENSCG